ncbi:hypothetical protein [Kitasatospora sp. NPDC088134]|uniref:hypothetical protein n=1 Tax=Kitasatospora sp. NPDC088134 TaxID=3364071 RepID=UPI0037F89307
MSLSRSAADAPQPAPPHRRFGRRRGGAAAAPPAGGAPAPAAPRPAPVARRSELRELGPHIVIAPASAGYDELWAALGALRPVPDSLVVVAAADDAAPVLRDRMGELGDLARARGAGVLVLAASGLAALAPNGRRPAEVVAARAGLPVIAPDGLVEITADGDLDVLSPDGAAGAASWWYCAPGAEPRRARRAARTPSAAPAPAPAPAVPPTVRVRRLPAGYWLTHAAAPPPGPLPGLALAAGPPGSTVLVVGTPGAPVLLPEDFVAAATALPVDPDRVLVSAPWAAPDELAALTAALTTRLDRPVHAAIGVPVLGATGPTSRILDAHGHPQWEPFLLRLAAVPGDAVSPTAWHNGGADWRTDRPAVFAAFPYWALEAVPAGLWLRPEPAHVVTPRFRRPETTRPLLIVGERDRPVAPDVFEELGCLLDRLPAVGVHGFGLLVHGLLDPAAATVARFVARTHDLDWLGPEQPVGAPPQPAPVSYGSVAPPPPRHHYRPAPPPTLHQHRPSPAPAIGHGPGTAPNPDLGPAAATTAATATGPGPLPDAVPAPDAVPPIGPPTRAATSSGPGLADAPATTATAATAHATAAAPEPYPATPPWADEPSSPRPEAPSWADDPDLAPRPYPTPEPDSDPDLAPRPYPTPLSDPETETDPDLAPRPYPAPEPDPAPSSRRPDGPSDPLPGPGTTPLPAAAARLRLLRPEELPPPAAATTVSTAAERDAVRALLGEHYHRCSGRVEQVSTRLPGVRSTAKDDIKPDLAAVLLHHTDAGVPADRDGLVAAARSGDPRLAPFLRCLGSGLRRLPSHHGAVLLGAPPGADPEELLALYRVGEQLTEPGPVTGLTASSVELPGVLVEFVIWSVTGRRTAAFSTGPEEARVTFSPGTVFTVLGALSGEATGSPARVLLRESGGPADADPAARDRNTLTRLHSWLDRRDRLGPADRRTVERPERFHHTPGAELLPAPPPA